MSKNPKKSKWNAMSSMDPISFGWALLKPVSIKVNNGDLLIKSLQKHKNKVRLNKVS